MACSAKEYIGHLLLTDTRRSHAALEMLVDDLHSNKDATIMKLLDHVGSEDYLWSIFRLLANNDSLVAGNAAYVIGTVAETKHGHERIMSLICSRQPECKIFLTLINQMLTLKDEECVMNAAGTLGTLAENSTGRNWLLIQPILDNVLEHLNGLLLSSSPWTASNASLVFARLVIDDDGCFKLLSHSMSDEILNRLVDCLVCDETGRGVNAAFTLGRICDTEIGLKRVLKSPFISKMISCFLKMLRSSAPSINKNACYAISCIASTLEGQLMLLQNPDSGEMISTLPSLLTSHDQETRWFATMTIKMLAKNEKGRRMLRRDGRVLPALQNLKENFSISLELQDEVTEAIGLLLPMVTPAPPIVEVLRPCEVEVSWSAVASKLDQRINCHVYSDKKEVYKGTDLSCIIKDLLPNNQYAIQLKLSNAEEESDLSEPTIIQTDEAVPDPPQNLRVVAATASQVKISWQPPAELNGNLKFYSVYLGKSVVEQTMDTQSILSGLQPATTYKISVCASTGKSRGAKEYLLCSTAELGDHAPSRPEVSVRGRCELFVSWKPPPVPMGRINRYDLSMDGNCIYSGTDLHFCVCRLKPDTEYTFLVSAITSEGKFESKPAKRKTAKDEFETERAPLYQTPITRHSELTVDDAKNKNRKPSSEKIASDKKPLRNPCCRSHSHNISKLDEGISVVDQAEDDHQRRRIPRKLLKNSRSKSASHNPNDIRSTDSTLPMMVPKDVGRQDSNVRRQTVNVHEPKIVGGQNSNNHEFNDARRQNSNVCESSPCSVKPAAEIVVTDKCFSVHNKSSASRTSVINLKFSHVTLNEYAKDCLKKAIDTRCRDKKSVENILNNSIGNTDDSRMLKQRLAVSSSLDTSLTNSHYVENIDPEDIPSRRRFSDDSNFKGGKTSSSSDSQTKTFLLTKPTLPAIDSSKRTPLPRLSTDLTMIRQTMSFSNGTPRSRLLLTNSSKPKQKLKRSETIHCTDRPSYGFAYQRNSKDFGDVDRSLNQV